MIYQHLMVYEPTNLILHKRQKMRKKEERGG